MPSIKVHKPGLCTTVQDIGRIGYQQFGIPVSGVMDEFAFTVANYLVESDKNNAVLEIPFLGPTLEFDFDVTIAITGGEIQAKINNQDVKMWESINVKKGDNLSFGNLKSGMRAYLAFSAEIDVPVVMGSKSTLLKSKLGGFEGRKLKMGDIINFKNVKVLSKKNPCTEAAIKEIADKTSSTFAIFLCLGKSGIYIFNFSSKTYPHLRFFSIIISSGFYFFLIGAFTPASSINFILVI